MSDATADSLRAIPRDQRQRVLDALDNYYWNEYIEGTRGLLIAGELGPEGMPLPVGYIKARIATADEALNVIRSTEPAWHIDVFEALQDFLKSLEDDPLLVLADMTEALRQAALITTNGEVRWPLALAPEAINELAGLGYVITGLDIWPDVEAAPTEIPLSDYDRGVTKADIEPARGYALDALIRVPEFGFSRPSILVTWALAT